MAVFDKKITYNIFNQAFENYLQNEDEKYLNIAYQFGKDHNNGSNLTTLDIVQIHFDILSKNISGQVNNSEINKLLCRASKFMAETMASVEIKNRSFESTLSQLQDQNKELFHLNSKLESEISERKRINELLIKSEEYFQSIIDNSLDLIMILNKNGNFIFINPTIKETLGYTPEELYDTSAFDLIHRHDVKQFIELFSEGIKQPLSLSKIEYRIKRKDGSWCYLESIARNLLYNSAVNGVLINSRDISERKKADKILRIRKEKLRKLAQRIEDIREDERINVAREIHDELGQMLTVLKIDISLTKKVILDVINSSFRNEIESKCASVSKRIDTIIQSIQRIANELRPEVLDKLGFNEALKWEIKQIKDRTELSINYDSTLNEDEIANIFNNKQLLSIFRIFQESIINVVRHADATIVDVELHKTDSNISLSISDNGRGINNKEIYSDDSFGILGMHERAISLGGKLKINSTPNKGTKIAINIPYK